MANTYITIAGTSYRYKKTEPSSGETWVLNETVNISGTNYYNNIEMTYSGQTRAYPIRSLKMYEYSDGPETGYDIYGEEESEYKEGNSKYGLYSTGGGATGWQLSQSGTAFNVWTFATAPTGDLLTWLQANGTKQGGGAVTGYNVTITTQNKLWDDPFCDMAIKFDSEPTSDTDYDFYVDMSGNITGNTSFTNKTTMWVWQTSGSSNRIGINGTTYTVNIWGTGGPNEFTLTENSAIIAYYHS